MLLHPPPLYFINRGDQKKVALKNSEKGGREEMVSFFKIVFLTYMVKKKTVSK